MHRKSTRDTGAGQTRRVRRSRDPLRPAPAASPDKPRPLSPRESWSGLEKWVWEQVQAGELADINAYFGEIADPRDPDLWSSERRISSSFVKDILFHAPWCSAIPRQGVRIFGAIFDEELDLSFAELPFQLWLEHSRFISNLDVNNLKILKNISFNDSVFTEHVDMYQASIGGSFFAKGADFAEVSLDYLTVGGNLELDGPRVTSNLDLRIVSVGGSLFARSKAQFAGVALQRAAVRGDLDLTGSTINGSLDMNGASIGGSLFMLEACILTDVDLVGAEVGAQLILTRSEIVGTLFMNGASIGNLCVAKYGMFTDVDLTGVRIESDLDMHNAQVKNNIILGSASIHGNVDGTHAICNGEFDFDFAYIEGSILLIGSTLNQVDMTGLKLIRELHLQSVSWLTRPVNCMRLTLRNASVDTIQDEPDAWPDAIDIYGFVYNRFGGAVPEFLLVKRSSKYFIDWIAKTEPYTPQPYYQCAKVLRDMGSPEMANDVLYAGRERERKKALRNGNNPHATGLTILKCFIGYGYGDRLLRRPLAWALAVLICGALLPNIAEILGLFGDRIAWCGDVKGTGGHVCLDQQSFESFTQLTLG